MDQQIVDINSLKLIQLRDRIGTSPGREFRDALQELTWTIHDRYKEIEEALNNAQNRLYGDADNT